MNSTHGSISLLGLAGLSGEDDQSRSVLVQSVNVELLSLLALASSSVVNGDTESLGLLLWDTSELELGKGESSALWMLAKIFTIEKSINPPLTRMLYRWVGHRTAGRSRWRGAAPEAKAFLDRATRLDFFFPGWSNWMLETVAFVISIPDLIIHPH